MRSTTTASTETNNDATDTAPDSSDPIADPLDNSDESDTGGEEAPAGPELKRPSIEVPRQPLQPSKIQKAPSAVNTPPTMLLRPTEQSPTPAEQGAASSTPDAGGRGAARQPELPFEIESVVVSGVSARQGRRSVIALADDCIGAKSATIEGLADPLIDADDNPQTLTLEIDSLELGTRAAAVECGGQIATFDLLVYRQTGRGRGGATGSALLGVGGLLGLAAALIRSTDELLR